VTLNDLRVKRGLEWTRFAYVSDTSIGTLKRMNRGERVKPETFARVAIALRMTPAGLADALQESSDEPAAVV
jgi:hypothetical protein